MTAGTPTCSLSFNPLMQTKITSQCILSLAVLLPLVATAQAGKVNNPLVTKDQ